jgi:hypothetical protein
MNRYILIRRLRGPAFVLLVGVMALLAQADILRWSQSWPLLLILAGALMLAERAALASEGYSPIPGAAGQNAGGATGPESSQSATNPGSAIVPTEPRDFGDHQSGAQS